ncbi:hypothetical protein BDP27DRAFT_1302629 [Rhodocollybia butyracea]|uniref:Uncharacterized protein n=1 Tax=Rhodocollybia butyracea TaxID=206335 RepID=A0A9P5TXF6_9AGAR|nr:hypothetical protein BDP27DRAFT_1302629 [Rhodocollybia butyracea]
MLRWLRSTVQKGGYGSQSQCIRVTQRCMLSVVRASKSEVETETHGNLIHSKLATGTVKGTNHASDCEILRRSLTSSSSQKLPLETLVSLYESVRARDQLRDLGPGNLSKMMRIFGAVSLPQDAPRIATQYAQGTSTPFWTHVQRMAKDKESMGHRLTDGDHYWLLWAWIAKFHSDTTGNIADTLSNASTHYHQIWRKTRFTDILAPYFDALLSSGDAECLRTAVNGLCGVLDLHSNLHGRSLRLIFDLFLSFSETLSPSLKRNILLSLWNRIAMTHTNTPTSHYMATHMYNALTKRHQPLPLDISRLVASLGTPLFPMFKLDAPLSVQQWARRRLRQALGPECSIAVRWANMSLFALYQASRSGLNKHITNLDTSFGPHFSDWHVVLTLGLLENIVPSNVVSSQGSEVHSVTGALWRKWTQVKSRRPILVSRAIIGAFLRLAGRTQDTYVFDQCRRWSVDNVIWRLDRTHSATKRTQVEALVGDYIEASIRCDGKDFGRILRFFETNLSVTGSYIEIIFEQLRSRDVETAHEFYELCISQRTPLETEGVTLLAVQLSETQAQSPLHIVARDVLGPEQVGRVLVALLDSVRVHRQRYLMPSSADILSRTLHKLLQSKAPIPRMKYPLRYAIPLLVASNRAVDAVRIIELINERAPSFIHLRFLHRVLRLLFRYRQFILATRLYDVVEQRWGLSLDTFRLKLILGLTRGRASALAARFLSSHSSTRFMRQEMVRSIGLNPRRSSPTRILSILRRKPDHTPSIKLALYVLILSKRTAAAKILFLRSLPYLDSDTKTWFGNMLLHRFVRRFTSRNVQVMKKLFKAKTSLNKIFGFTGDRVTFNIFMKGMLYWKNVDAPRARVLFDDCIRIGYPIGSRWQQISEVPFATRTITEPLLFGLHLSPDISFQHHTRPLYKMFIKAFYIRKDVMAAQAVVAILKNEEVEELSRQQNRNRARFEGLHRARDKKSS